MSAASEVPQPPAPMIEIFFTESFYPTAGSACRVAPDRLRRRDVTV
jgi:hypothetical protein